MATFMTYVSSPKRMKFSSKMRPHKTREESDLLCALKHTRFATLVPPLATATTPNVTAQYRDLIQDMIEKTCESNYIGIGKDSHRLTHRSFRVKSVHQIQNPNLLRDYQHCKSQMGSRPSGCRQQLDVLTRKCALSKHSGLDQNVNEVYLFHGTRYTAVDKISKTLFRRKLIESGRICSLQRHG
eukprot:c10070_g1_i4.p1 GENE.c10070_g1_i4~~c10070_g1_i4.p1  ORF type:complete len:184 (+),score=35.03 c10070_g1_i4:218-769(+)